MARSPAKQRSRVYGGVDWRNEALPGSLAVVLMKRARILSTLRVGRNRRLVSALQGSKSKASIHIRPLDQDTRESRIDESFVPSWFA